MVRDSRLHRPLSTLDADATPFPAHLSKDVSRTLLFVPATRRAVARGKEVPLERVQRVILLLRGHRVMLDTDLAALYEVPIKRLNDQVARNLGRFPADFMFQLTVDEISRGGFSSGGLSPR